MTVSIFIPCIIDQIYPQTAVNMEKILKHYNVDVDYPEEQTCCGQMAYKNGLFDQAMELGDKFIGEFNNGNTVVIPAVSCAVMIKQYYPKIFYNSSRHNDLKQLVPRTFEFADFFYNQLGIQKISMPYNADVTIHTSCSELRDYTPQNSTELILKSIDGVNVFPLPEADVCCGFGGSFSVKNPHISASMAADKIQNAINTGAQYLIANDPSCLMHLQTYVKKQKLAITPIHLIDFLALVHGL